MTSTDGITWFAQNSGTNIPLEGITWNGSQFIAVGGYNDNVFEAGNNIILTSQDGIIWIPQNSSTDTPLYEVAWNGSQWVTLGQNGTILVSSDGITWLQQTLGVRGDLFSIVSNGSQFVVVGDAGIILTSSDGVTWSQQESGTNTPLYGVTWNDNQFIARGENLRITSPDGVVWSQQNVKIDTSFYGTAWNGSQFVAVKGRGIIMTSSDGITWSQQYSGTNNYLFAVAWDGRQFIAVGDFNTVLTSPDGVVWSQQNLDADGFIYRLNDIIWNGQQLVAVGSGSDRINSFSAILTSPDGVTWSQQNLSAQGSLYTITWNGSRFVAIGESYDENGAFSIIQTSLDGIIWSPQKIVSNNGYLYGIAWNGRRFVVVGDGGTILTAQDTNNSAVLESPQAGSYESGIGLIRGWACHANKIEIQIDSYPRIQAAYGTSRQDTASVCGDDNNGFGLTYNWNLLGDGQHSVQAFVDGAEFGIASFTVTTLGQEFLSGAQAHYPITDFPAHNPQPFELVWSSATQNFVIAETFTIPGSGANGNASHQLENPVTGALVSGIGLISGWVCQANTIELEIDHYPRIQAAYGTSRQDTASVCGDGNNGFGLTVNWNLLGDGPHSVRVFADGVLFGQSEFVVTTLGTKFLTGASGSYRLPDFPQPGAGVIVQWSEAHQNFVIIGD